MDDFEKSKVYIQIDEYNRILACEGGLTMANIKNFDEWIFIDEGNGDKYNLCQSHYFEGGLYTEAGVCRYKYVEEVCVLRSKEEIDADTPNEPAPTGDDVWAELDKAFEEGYKEGVNSI